MFALLGIAVVVFGGFIVLLVWIAEMMDRWRMRWRMRPGRKPSRCRACRKPFTRFSPFDVYCYEPECRQVKEKADAERRAKEAYSLERAKRDEEKRQREAEEYRSKPYWEKPEKYWDNYDRRLYEQEHIVNKWDGP